MSKRIMFVRANKYAIQNLLFVYTMAGAPTIANSFKQTHGSNEAGFADGSESSREMMVLNASTKTKN